MNNSENYVHPTAIIDPGAKVSSGVKIWHFCHVRTGAKLFENVSLGRDVFVDQDVEIGKGTRIQNGVSIYKGVSLKDFVFVGPHVIFTNDQFPRVNKKNWQIVPTVLENGCSIGAGSIIRCGVTVGAFAMVGAGSIVTKDVEPFTLIMGLPALVKKNICACGNSQFELSEKMNSPFCNECATSLTAEMLDLAQREFNKR